MKNKWRKTKNGKILIVNTCQYLRNFYLDFFSFGFLQPSKTWRDGSFRLIPSASLLHCFDSKTMWEKKNMCNFFMNRHLPRRSPQMAYSYRKWRQPTNNLLLQSHDGHSVIVIRKLCLFVFFLLMTLWRLVSAISKPLKLSFSARGMLSN